MPRRRSIPERLTLNGKTWRVRLVKGLLEREGVLGLCELHKRTISIDADQPHAEKHLTLTHEVLHAIWPQGVISDRTEEKLVEQLEERVHAAFKVRR